MGSVPSVYVQDVLVGSAEVSIRMLLLRFASAMFCLHDLLENAHIENHLDTVKRFVC